MAGLVAKAISGLRKLAQSSIPVGMSAVSSSGSAGYIREPFMGAWQKNQALNTRDGMLASSAVFACVDLISSDVAKLRIKYVRLAQGVWLEGTAPRYSNLLRKPNPYQTRQQFIKAWVASKLTHGNAYVWLVRNRYGAVLEMHVLNPKYVVPLVAVDGSVFYQITMSPLQVAMLETTVVPASDIIHDRGITSWHPLVGMTPIAACAGSATLASSITNNSAAFFSNAARPSGFLSAPGPIGKETAERLKQQIEDGYSGGGSGKTLVGGDGLVYSAMTMTGADAQTIEQLQWTAQDVARCFHVPGHKIGLDGSSRTGASSAIYESMYYSDCLQAYLESIELLLDDCLNVPDGQGFEFDTTGLMRMDEGARHSANAQAVGSGVMAPNEARATIGLPPVKGGETPYLQQQNYALSALAARDAANPAPSSNAPATSDEEDDTDTADDTAQSTSEQDDTSSDD